MKTVKMVGFDKSVPKEFKLEARTYRELLDGLKSHPQLDSKKTEDRYISEIEGVQSSAQLFEEIESDVVVIRCKRKTNKNTLRGSGDAQTRIIIGIIIIVVAIWLMPQVTVGFIGSSATYSLNTVLASVGLSLVMGGVAELLMPKPENENTDKRSNTAQGYPNTTRAGTPIPIILGEHRFGGHFFSFNLETANQSSAKFEDFMDIIWDEANNNRRDSWMTLYYNSETNQTSGAGEDTGGGGRWTGGGDYYIP